jgi:hypothetical protein
MSKPLEGKSDKEILEHILLSAMMTKLHGESQEQREMSATIEPALRRCVELMEKASANTGKLINVSEDLAVERASNKRLRACIAKVALLLAGDPYSYPAEIRDVAIDVHRENGSLEKLLAMFGRKMP